MRRLFSRLRRLARGPSGTAVAVCPPGVYDDTAVRKYIHRMPVTPYVTKDDFYAIVDRIYTRTHPGGPVPIPDSAHPNCSYWRKVWLSVRNRLEQSGKARPVPTVPAPKPPPMGGLSLNPRQQRKKSLFDAFRGKRRRRAFSRYPTAPERRRTPIDVPFPHQPHGVLPPDPFHRTPRPELPDTPNPRARQVAGWDTESSPSRLYAHRVSRGQLGPSGQRALWEVAYEDPQPLQGRYGGGKYVL